MLCMPGLVHFSENLSKMGPSRHCSEEQRTLITKLIGEERTYKEVQKLIGCSAKMISDALKWQPKPEKRKRKQKTTIRMDGRIAKMAIDQLQGDERRCKVTCEYCNH